MLSARIGYEPIQAPGATSSLAGISARFDGAIAAQQSRIAGLNDLIATLVAQMQALDPPGPPRPMGENEPEGLYLRRLARHRQKVAAFEAAWKRLETAVALANRKIQEAQREIGRLGQEKINALDSAMGRIRRSVEAARARRESTIQRDRTLRNLQDQRDRTLRQMREAYVAYQGVANNLASTMERGLEDRLGGSAFEASVSRFGAAVMLHEDDDGIADAYRRGVSIELREAGTGQRADADLLVADTLSILPFGEELDSGFVDHVLDRRLDRIDLSADSFDVLRGQLVNPAWADGFAPPAKWDETARAFGMQTPELMIGVLDIDTERYATELRAYQNAYRTEMAARRPAMLAHELPMPSRSEIEEVAVRILASYRLDGTPTSLLDPAQREVIEGISAHAPAMRLEELKAAGLVEADAVSYPRLEAPPEFVEAGYSNGRLPDGALVPLGIHGHQLYAPAAEAFFAMIEAARADGIELSITDSYRTYAGQVRCKEKWTARGKPNMAATPGTSNHGWGLAVDMHFAPDGAPQSRAEGLAWMRERAYDFGFVEALRPGDSYEDWHWEFRPSGDASASRLPAPEGLETLLGSEGNH